MMDRYCDDGLAHDIGKDIDGTKICTVCEQPVDNPDVKDIKDEMMGRYCKDNLPHDIHEDPDGIEFCVVCGENVDNSDD